MLREPVDPETHAATLVIERIHPADKGDILDGTTFERMRTLVGNLAGCTAPTGWTRR